METFFELLAICVGNSPVTCEFTAQSPVTWSFKNIIFDLRRNKHLSKQLRGWLFEMQSRQLWRHCNDVYMYMIYLCAVRQSYILQEAYIYRRGNMNSAHKYTYVYI